MPPKQNDIPGTERTEAQIKELVQRVQTGFSGAAAVPHRLSEVLFVCQQLSPEERNALVTATRQARQRAVTYAQVLGEL